MPPRRCSRAQELPGFRILPRSLLLVLHCDPKESKNPVGVAKISNDPLRTCRVIVGKGGSCQDARFLGPLRLGKNVDYFDRPGGYRLAFTQTRKIVLRAPRAERVSGDVELERKSTHLGHVLPGIARVKGMPSSAGADDREKRPGAR